MKTTGIPPGLAGLLGKLGLGPQPKADGKVDAKAMQAVAEGKDPKAVEKGTHLGDGTLLAGLGFNPEDRHAAMKNTAEKAAIDRFMQDPGADVKELQQALRQMKDEGLGKDLQRALEKAEAKADAKELREELRKDEKLDDVRGQIAQEAKEKKEARETAESKENEKERQQRERDQQDDDGEKHGSAWAEEQREQEDEPKKRRGALHEADAVGEHARCHGKLEDGTRCLRRPMQGTPYCREHVIPST